VEIATSRSPADTFHIPGLIGRGLTGKTGRKADADRFLHDRPHSPKCNRRRRGSRPETGAPNTVRARRAGGVPGPGIDPQAFLRQRLGPDSRDLYAETHRELDRLLLPRVLEHTGGNQARAGLLLGIARRTLRTKLQDLGLHVAHSVKANADHLP
jgi:transcriptional regulator with GAF, ATPase, and Fis domain